MVWCPNAVASHAYPRLRSCNVRSDTRCLSWTIGKIPNKWWSTCLYQKRLQDITEPGLLPPYFSPFPWVFRGPAFSWPERPLKLVLQVRKSLRTLRKTLQVRYLSKVILFCWSVLSTSRSKIITFLFCWSTSSIITFPHVRNQHGKDRLTSLSKSIWGCVIGVIPRHALFSLIKEIKKKWSVNDMYINYMRTISTLDGLFKESQ